MITMRSVNQFDARPLARRKKKSLDELETYLRQLETQAGQKEYIQYALECIVRGLAEYCLEPLRLNHPREGERQEYYYAIPVETIGELRRLAGGNVWQHLTN